MECRVAHSTPPGGTTLYGADGAFGHKITPEQAITLSLVRLAADPARAQSPALDVLVGAADPARLMDLLVRGRLLTTLAPHLVDDPSVRLPAWFAERTAAARTMARQHGLLQHTLTSRITDALESEGIRAVPLKGTALAAAVHGDLGARLSTDLDLLVPQASMDAAVAVVTRLGWTEDRLSAPDDGLPRLHRVLGQPGLPPVEIHWRVHWYESAFAEEALQRAQPSEEGWRRLAPPDELACLLLFLARDGFAGLRQAADIAAWWNAVGRQASPAGGVREIAERHPALERALGASAAYAEERAGLNAGSLLASAGALSRSQRLALRLANPWLVGSRQQVDAEVSLIDGLLGPPGTMGAFTRRAHRATRARDPEAQPGAPGRFPRSGCWAPGRHTWSE